MAGDYTKVGVREKEVLMHFVQRALRVFAVEKKTERAKSLYRLKHDSKRESMISVIMFPCLMWKKSGDKCTSILQVLSQKIQ